MDYFFHFFPVQVMTDILTHTNQAMAALQRPSAYPLEKAELLRWFGIQLAMAVEPKRGGIDAYFEKQVNWDTVHTAGNYEDRFKMNQCRFQSIKDSMCFCTGSNMLHVDEVELNQIPPFLLSFFFSLSHTYRYT